jgi:tRNA(Ile)-lysidine synthase
VTTPKVIAALAGLPKGVHGVACSGGVDSMALADAAIETLGAPNVVVITIDHGLVAVSGHVAGQVAAWARGRGAAAVVRRVEVVRQASLEAAARDARYAAFEAIADELGLVAVMTAHTARDQAETVLLRLLRGTGPAGLAGIPRRRGRFVRPLLAIERADVEAYVAERRLPTWPDPMNDDPRIARNRVRDKILPVLRRENPQLDAGLVRLAASAGEWLAVIDSLAQPFAQLPIACGDLARQPPAVRKRALALALDAAGLGYDAVHLEQLDRIVTSRPRGELGIDLPGGRIVRSYDRLSTVPASHASTISAPPGYTLRVWRPGDRMKPIRLKGRSRKLSDLYIDAKVPREQRLGARVLVRDADDTIVWAEHLGLAFGEPAVIAPTRTDGPF